MKRSQAAFTLVELMVATAILTLMMVILLQMTGQTANTWRTGVARAEQFQEARKAYETMTRRIGEATLNTYWDYYRPEGAANTAQNSDQILPTEYVRQSELRFRVVKMDKVGGGNGGKWLTHGIFFQAPEGVVEEDDNNYAPLTRLDGLLNSWGYFMEVENTSRVPKFLESNYPKRLRSRLMEFRQPTQQFDLYRRLASKLAAQTKEAVLGFPSKLIPQRDPQVNESTGLVTDPTEDNWFLEPLKLASEDKRRPTRILAENVLALVILPRLSPQDEDYRRSRAISSTSGIDPKQVLLTPDFTYHSKQKSNYTGSAYNKDRLDPEINPKNQLPPVVQVTMFAIDEASAQRLAELKRSTPDLGLGTMLSQNGGLFEKVSDLNPTNSDVGDLRRFEDELIKLQLSYRVFSSNVSIRGAKWSRGSKN